MSSPLSGRSGSALAMRTPSGEPCSICCATWSKVNDGRCLLTKVGALRTTARGVHDQTSAVGKSLASITSSQRPGKAMCWAVNTLPREIVPPVPNTAIGSLADNDSRELRFARFSELIAAPEQRGSL